MQLRTCLVFVVLLSVGCNGGGDSQNQQGNQPVQPAPAPVNVLNWGELPCQKAMDCENPVLKLKQDYLIGFLERNWNQEDKDSPKKRESFSCGKEFVEKWNGTFSSWVWEKVPSTQKVLNFAFQTLNLKTCQLKEEPAELLENYFKNTKEYKNEVQ